MAGRATEAARLAFRPPAGPPQPRVVRPGESRVGADSDPAAIAYEPVVVRGDRLVVALHGAGGTAGQAVNLLRPVADGLGLRLLAPQSQLATWDGVASRFGPDVRRLDALLAEVSSTRRVERLTLAGFSDGASYALSLGLANGDLVHSVIAFSPGFAAPPDRHGRPRVFVSHGTDDRVLPVDRCSRRLVPALREAGHEVTYEEFDGGHVVPPEVVRHAGEWLVAPDP